MAYVPILHLPLSKAKASLVACLPVFTCSKPIKSSGCSFPFSEKLESRVAIGGLESWIFNSFFFQSALLLDVSYILPIVYTGTLIAVSWIILLFFKVHICHRLSRARGLQLMIVTIMFYHFKPFSQVSNNDRSQISRSNVDYRSSIPRSFFQSTRHLDCSFLYYPFIFHK